MFSPRFLRAHVSSVILVGFSFLSVFSIVDRGGIHLTSYILFGASVFPVAALFFIDWHYTRAIVCVPKFFSALFAFVLFLWISMFLSPVRGEGFRELVSFTAGGMIFLFLSMFSFTARQVKAFFSFLLGLGLLELFYAFYIYVYGSFDRLAGTFQDFQFAFAFFPNALANFLLFLVPVSGYFFLQSKTKREEVFHAVVLIFFLAGLFLTYSRGAFLALIVSGAVSFFVAVFFGHARSREFRMRLARLFPVIILSFFVVFQVNSFRASHHVVTSFEDKVKFQANEGVSSASERLDFWNGSLSLIRERPFFGSGPYSFQYVYPRFQKELLAVSDHPHNIVLKIAVENGLFAACFFLLFLVGLAIFTRRSLSSAREPEKAVIFAMGAGVFGAFVHNLSDYNFNFLSNAMLFWVFLGLIVALARRHRSSATVPVGRVFRVCTAVFVILFSFFIFHEAYFGFWYKAGRSSMADGSPDKAIEFYEKAEPLWFKRRLYFDKAYAYHELYRHDPDEHFLANFLSYLEKAAQYNPLSAFFIGEKAKWELFYGKIDDVAAERAFLSAISLDPLNNLAYYLHLLRIYHERSDSRAFDAMKENVSALLARYAVKLRYNEHLTVLTDNPRYAMEMYDLLAEADTEGNAETYVSERDKLVQFWKAKAEEMADDYGIVVSLFDSKF